MSSLDEIRSWQSSLGPEIFYVTIHSFIQSKSLGSPHRQQTESTLCFVWFVLKVEWGDVDSWGKIQIVQRRLQSKPCHSITTPYFSFRIVTADFRSGGSVKSLGHWAPVRRGHLMERWIGEIRGIWGSSERSSHTCQGLILSELLSSKGLLYLGYTLTLAYAGKMDKVDSVPISAASCSITKGNKVWVFQLKFCLANKQEPNSCPAWEDA